MTTKTSEDHPKIFHKICGGVGRSALRPSLFPILPCRLVDQEIVEFLSTFDPSNKPARPAQVSPDGLRYFGGTFFPFKTLAPPRTTLRPPTTAVLSNCFSISARRSSSFSSTRLRRSISASTLIPDRF